MSRIAAFLSVPILMCGIGAASAAPFDGSWSVLIVTQEGTCDSYRYAVSIQGGTVKLAEDAPVTLSGKVEDSGSVKVSVARGAQRADGSGKLSGNRGSGAWTGKAQNSQCSGRWEAEKR